MPMPMGVTGIMRPNMVPPTPGYPPRQTAFQQLPPGGFISMATGQAMPPGQAMYAPTAGYAAQAGPRAMPGGPPGGNMYGAPPTEGAAGTPLSQGSMRPIAASGGMRPVVPGAAPTGAAMAIPGKGAPLPGAGGSSALAQPAPPPLFPPIIRQSVCRRAA